jgi:uncharacterized protein YkwD
MSDRQYGTGRSMTPTSHRGHRSRAVAALLITLLALAGLVAASPAHADAYDQATLYDLTNGSRTTNGLGALQWDPELAAIAQEWAAQLAANGGLSHRSDLADQVGRRVTNQWTRIGENVGYAPSLDAVQDAFMGSTGHRNNILGDYNRVGVGVVRTGSTVWVVVNFLKGPDRPGYEPSRPAVPSSIVGWYLRPGANSGAPAISFQYGIGTYQLVHGNWDGISGDGIGAYVDGSWYLRNSPTGGNPDVAVRYGYPGAIPVVGDWDGNGTDTIGVYDNGWWYLRNSNTPGAPDIVINYGGPDLAPVTGDWDGNGTDTIGVYSNGSWYLRNRSAGGNPDLAFAYGTAGYTPVVGHWAGGATDGIGVYVNGSWNLRYVPSPGRPDISITYGTTGYGPMPGDWTGKGIDGVGVIVG